MWIWVIGLVVLVLVVGLAWSERLLNASASPDNEKPLFSSSNVIFIFFGIIAVLGVLVIGVGFYYLIFEDIGKDPTNLDVMGGAGNVRRPFTNWGSVGRELGEGVARSTGRALVDYADTYR